jgi:hypothetical protein
MSFIYDDALLVRLKKADYTLRTSNYPTPLADLFDEHRRDLFGFQGLQRVEAVYIPNRFDTGILWTGVVAREKHVKLWHFELVEAAAVPVATIPIPAPRPAASLAKLKNQKEQKKSDESDGK